MLSGCPPGEFDGAAESDSISGGNDQLADEYTSDGYDDGWASLPVAEADDDGEEAAKEEEAGHFLPEEKGSVGELDSGGGDVECPECGKFFKNDKSLFGHLRSHPNRGYKGVSPPPEKKKLMNLSSLQDDTEDDAALPAPSLSSPNDVDGSPGQCSGRDPQLTPFEMFCTCVMLTLRCRDGQGPEHQPPPPPSFGQEQLGAVDEGVQVGTERPVTNNVVAAQVKTKGPGPEIVNALLCDDGDGSIVKVPKKRRRSTSNSKEDGEANKKAKLVTTTRKEKRAYVCKHCKTEYSTCQALGGHMAAHHREKKTTPPAALNTNETSRPERQVMAAGQSQRGRQQQARRGDGSWRDGGRSILSRRLQVEQLPMASSNMGWLPRQAPGGHAKLHFVRRKGDTPPAVTSVPADGDRRRQLNTDLNVELPEQD